jgi:hypothetical protein
MKKLMFTAIALIAFSGISVANTGEAKKEIKRVNCSSAWSVAYHYARESGFRAAQSNTIAIAAYDKCIGCDN